VDLPGGTITPKQVRRRVHDHVNDEHRRQLAASVTDLHPDVRCGDFRAVLADVRDGSVSAVITDPPYDRDSIPLYCDLAALAKRVLVPGGTLACVLPSANTGDALDLVRRHLDLLAILTLRHAGGASQLNHHRLNVRCKQIGWFGRRGEQRRGRQLDTLLPSAPPDKTNHDWAQSPVEYEYLIEHLTEPGELVLDPFIGSGTTLAAALRLGRQALGAEIDEECAKVASALLARCGEPTAEEVAAVLRGLRERRWVESAEALARDVGDHYAAKLAVGWEEGVPPDGSRAAVLEQLRQARADIDTWIADIEKMSAP
jgi:hypothetical protein